jgi:hypothetical protein
VKNSGKGIGTRPMIGAYYFDGWGGRNSLADDPSQPWAKDAPTHLTQRMVDEFPDREPVWGWRADSGPNSRDGDRDGFAAMQETARQAGLPGLAIAGCGGEVLDAGYTHQSRYNVVPGWEIGLEEHTYAELTAANQAAWRGSVAQPGMPVVTAGWDRRPWENPADPKQKFCWYHPDRTPAQFAASVRDAVAWMDQNPEKTTAERIVLVYAWNEFGEGGHIAPTKGDPEGKYLQALRSAVMAAV